MNCWILCNDSIRIILEIGAMRAPPDSKIADKVGVG